MITIERLTHHSIKQLDYNHDTCQLVVRYHNGATLTCNNVSGTAFAALCEAPNIELELQQLTYRQRQQQQAARRATINNHIISFLRRH